MSELDHLISYWKDKLKEHPPLNDMNFYPVVRVTIQCLTELRKLKGE